MRLTIETMPAIESLVTNVSHSEGHCFSPAFGRQIAAGGAPARGSILAPCGNSATIDQRDAK